MTQLDEKALEPAIMGSRFMRIANRLLHLLRPNARKNIEAHYDLGHDFYRQWLDHFMLCSSTIWTSDTHDQSAQLHRLEREEKRYASYRTNVAALILPPERNMA